MLLSRVVASRFPNEPLQQTCAKFINAQKIGHLANSLRKSNRFCKGGKKHLLVGRLEFHLCFEVNQATEVRKKVMLALASACVRHCLCAGPLAYSRVDPRTYRSQTHSINLSNYITVDASFGLMLR